MKDIEIKNEDASIFRKRWTGRIVHRPTERWYGGLRWLEYRLRLNEKMYNDEDVRKNLPDNGDNILKTIVGLRAEIAYQEVVRKIIKENV